MPGIRRAFFLPKIRGARVLEAFVLLGSWRFAINCGSTLFMVGTSAKPLSNQVLLQRLGHKKSNITMAVYKQRQVVRFNPVQKKQKGFKIV